LKQYNFTFMTGSGKATESGAITKVITYPNPFPHSSKPDGGMMFAYSLSDAGKNLKIKIYTVSGEFVKEIESQSLRKGYNEVHWNGYNKDNKPVASGTYIYIVYFTDGSGTEHKKLDKFTVLR